MKQSMRDEIYAENFADEWNAAHPVGCRVTVRRDDGTLFHTTTRSASYVAANNRAVIFVEGIASYYLLDRVQGK